MADSDDWGDAWGDDAEAAPILDKKAFDYDKLDLNKLSDFELNRHKAAMEVEYQKNFVKKGDEGFEYDKRKDFTAANNAVADWDEDDDDDEDISEEIY